MKSPIDLAISSRERRQVLADYLASIGRKGGSVKSPAKAASSRANGLLSKGKGGRPKGSRNKAKGKAKPPKNS